MSEISKRIRKRGEKKQDYFEATTQEPPQEEAKPEIIKQEPEEKTDSFMSLEQLKKANEKSQIRQAINQMHADLIDDRRQELDEIIEEGLFDGEVSDEYWFFLGRYE